MECRLVQSFAGVNNLHSIARRDTEQLMNDERKLPRFIECSA